MTAFFKQLPQVLLLYKKHKAKARAFHKGKRVAGKTQSSKVMFSKKLTKDIIFEVGEELPKTVEYIWFVLNYHSYASEETYLLRDYGGMDFCMKPFNETADTGDPFPPRPSTSCLDSLLWDDEGHLLNKGAITSLQN